MTFLRLLYNDEHGDGDLAVSAGRLVTSESLETAVFESLFRNRRASDDELKRWGFTPDQNQGSWQEDYALVPGDQEGSLLWLLRRAKKTDATLRAAEGFAEDALKWMRADQAAKSVSARAYWYPNTDWLVIEIDIVKADGERWQRAWDAFTGESLPVAA